MVIPGVPEAEIAVDPPSRIACFIWSVLRPDIASVPKPICMVLHVIAALTLGIKSTFSKLLARYG